MSTLAGYHIHYGTRSQDYPTTINVTNPGIATYLVQGLSPATYYFAVSAYDSEGEESQYSQELAVLVTGTGASSAGTSATADTPSTSSGGAPTACATLGNSSVASASVDSGDQNTMSGSPITVGAQSITVSSVMVWINNAQAAPNNQFEVAIYTDEGGKPGTLVAASNEQSIVPQGWNTAPLSATLSANATYWLLYNTNASEPTLNEMSLSPSSTGNSWFSGNPGSAAFGTWPTTAPAGQFQNPAQLYSIYLSYE